jgi:malonyl CoA-acyl carrier protein transacylase/thioesterase domain-containing protein/acyl carrier protein
MARITDEGSGGRAVAQLVLISADGDAELERVTSELTEMLSGGKPLEEIARCLNSCGADAYRRILVCADRDDALAVLRSRDPKRLITHHCAVTPGPAVFLLQGVGDQYVGMAHGLYQRWEVFRNELDRCALLFQRHLQLDIREVLYPPNHEWLQSQQPSGYDLKAMVGRSSDAPQDADNAALSRTSAAQPALFAIQYSMVRFWQSMGVEPQAMVCHSLGEYVAACIAGVISLEDAISLVSARAKLVEALPPASMLSVLLSEQELRALLPADVVLSLINGPKLCVVAGPPASIDGFERVLAGRGVIAVRVRNSHAFHSSLMEPIAAEFGAHARKVALSAPKIPYTSNVTGAWISPEDASDPEYWVRHLTCTARFNDALHHLWGLRDPVLIECGAGRTLAVLAGQHPERQISAARMAISPIRQRYENVPDENVFLTAVGKAWLNGLAALSQWTASVPTQQFGAHSGSAAPQPGDSASTYDSAALAKPPAGGSPAASGYQRDASYVAPRNDLEISLTRACERILGVARVGIHDNFFELGGHSLAVIKLAVEMKQTTGLDINLGEIFRSPTVAQLVEHLGTDAARNASIVVSLQPKGSKPPMFCLCGIDLYKRFALELDQDQPVYGVYVAEEQAIISDVLRGDMGGVSIDRLVDAYHDAIIRFQPEGPYRFAGVSFGGLLAVALARKLRQSGIEVDIVFLFDTLLPEARRRIWWKWILIRLEALVTQEGFQQLLRKVQRRLASKISIQRSTLGSTTRIQDEVETGSYYQQFIQQQRTAFRAAYKQWNPEQSILDFPVVLFRAGLRDIWAPGFDIAEDYGWGRYVGRKLSVVDVPGGHISMLADPYVGGLARQAQQHLP